MIEFNYTTTSDSSVLDPPKYIKLDKIYNLILIPDNIKISPSDSILINDRPHKVALESGNIDFNNQKYTYLYIAPGFTYQYRSKYNVTINNIKYDLETAFSNKYNPKILYGLLILPDNFLYLFKDQRHITISDGLSSYKTKLINCINKYNFYMGQKNNTLLNILDSSNISSLQHINQEYQDSIFIRPLYNPNFPLGSITFDIKGVNNYCGLSIVSDNYNQKILIDPNKSFTIDNLSFGNYSINLFNKDTILYSTNITINKPITMNTPNRSSLSNFYHKKQPKKNLANLLINLPQHESFEIKGPNNFYRKFNNGYQYLQNILEGYYTITGSSYTKTLYVIKNDNNYIS